MAQRTPCSQAASPMQPTSCADVFGQSWAVLRSNGLSQSPSPHVQRFVAVISRTHVAADLVEGRRCDTCTDGAFMEPRGCNPWQSAANRPGPETAKPSEIR